ncbi:hypothetical protein C8Q70DRAFT_928014, partial [Cubamyces menziesii]
LEDWERRGWIGIENADVIREIVAALRSRSAQTTFRWVKGHSGVEGNERADRLAAEGAELDRPYLPNRTPTCTEYLKDGAELCTLTQKLAYKGIRIAKGGKEPLTTKTAERLARVTRAVESHDGSLNSVEALWGAIQGEAIDKKPRDFIWKALHGGHRVGSFWRNIPGCEGRAKCSKCNTTETMWHILGECGATGGAHLWGIAKRFLQNRDIVIPDRPTAELQLGMPLCEVKDEEDNLRIGETRLLRIITTETTYLVWKVRCERVIEWEGDPGREHSPADLTRRWYAAINARLDLDMKKTSKRLAGRKAAPVQRVLATWTGSLENQNDLPEDWTGSAGVLVGRPDMRPNG